MPLPKPHKDEEQDAYMARCMHEAYGSDAPSDRTQEQAIAMCLQTWRDRNKSAKAFDCPEPDDDETHSDYMDRCVDEVSDDDVDPDDAEEACQMAWEDSRSARGMIEKTHAEAVHGMEFILSDETPDRLGDIINADSWDLTNFQKNPIALFNHTPSFVIGRWSDLRVEKGALRGRLIMAPAGTSARIDEIRKLIDADILKAVSVGFRSIEEEPINAKDPWKGTRFLKSELVETSLVSVPANPNALAVAKSLNISPATLDLVFAKHGNQDRITRRGFTGKHADTSRTGKGSAMNGLAQRISDIEVKLVESKDKLAEMWTKVDDSNVSDVDLQTITDLNAEIGQLTKKHTALIDSEKALAKTVSNGQSTGRGMTIYHAPSGDQHERIVSSPAIIHKKKEMDLIDYLVRAGTVNILSRATHRVFDDVRQEVYGEDETTKVICDLILRAASAPAITTVAGWAAELVQQTYTDLMPLLMPAAILTRLAAKGLALSFGRAGRIIIPTRNRTPTIAGSFVGEGMAIPVRQGAFSSQTLVPKKMAVISVWTREMNDHSIPAIEGLIREAIQQDTSVAVDTVLLDSNAATTIRPAGLLNGVAATTATAGGGLAALIGDITALLGAITTNTYGNVRTPAFLVNPTDMLRASLLQATNTGIFPFRDEIRGGTLNGIPLIDSATVTAKTVILIDAADFVVVGGEAPIMTMSDQATLHMEDTSPLDLVSGSPGTVASPQRSLFQTDSMALRMVLPLNWVQRRAGTVAWTQSVTW